MDKNQPIALGDLIALLEARPQDQGVSFDFCGLVPTSVDSYRGYYDHLAMGWSADGAPKVADLLGRLREALGAVFTGYKGGEFRMDADTPMWVANYGRSDSTAIIGISECDYWAFIETARCEDWDGGTVRALQVLGGLGSGNLAMPRGYRGGSHAP
jgi:hypothetical protein